jgi:ribonuclease BN (tRNA processing enzyme)
VDLDDLPARLEVGELHDGSEERIGHFLVKAASIFHPAPALAFRLEADDSALVYATDTEDPFSGKPNPVITLSMGADTLIHDAQFTETDFKPSWGHSTIDSAIDVAVKAQVKRLVLYHHDPDRSDDALDRIAVEAQKQTNERARGIEVLVAREGMELTI